MITLRFQGVFYSYDIHGNVKTLWQDNPDLAAINTELEYQRFKRIDYDYDLVSGKVNNVFYQNEQPDAFAHHYEYDADNRITSVFTSRTPLLKCKGDQDKLLWDRDATYIYYKHGPLARVELGDNNVQGIDYAYTLQGWIKGVNSETLDKTRDMGQDGNTGSLNANFAKDVFGYSLNYFTSDYTAIGLNANNFIADKTDLTNLATDAPDLYNGNISSMVTTITDLTTGSILPQITAYKYDQLNRIKQMKAFAEMNFGLNKWYATSWTDRYKNKFNYDANGNLDTLIRYNAAGENFDNFTYNYLKDGNGKLMQNRLYHLRDLFTTPLASGEDIIDQDDFDETIGTINTANNYGYDEIGNLKRDDAEGIDDIEWTVYGKVKSITRSYNFTKIVNGITIYPSDLEFLYDATGNRIAKIEKPRDVNGLKSSAEWKTTYYTRDAQGNVMATYKLQPEIINNDPVTTFKLKEFDMYGSSRLGTNNEEINLIDPLPILPLFSHSLGLKQFELSNHLGNVLSTVSDNKIQIDTDQNGFVDAYSADITSATDYYPFGMEMPGRNFNSNSYKFGFNGKLNDDEVYGEGNFQDYGMRMYDTRTCRFISVDPLTKEYPWYTPYQFAGNKPIWAIDLDGKEEYYMTDYYNTAGELYKTETRVVTGDITAGIIVHRSNVVYATTPSGATTATVTYAGTKTGSWSDKGNGPFANSQEKTQMATLHGFKTDRNGNLVVAPNKGFGIQDKASKGAGYVFIDNTVSPSTTSPLTGDAAEGYFDIAHPTTNGAPADDYVPQGTNAVPKEWKERNGGKFGMAQAEPNVDQAKQDANGNTYTIKGYTPTTTGAGSSTTTPATTE